MKQSLETTPLADARNGSRSANGPVFAYEVKFRLAESAVERLLARAREFMAPDSHAGGETHDVYQIASLYFDTPDFLVYQRHGSYGRSKFRLRRYGAEPFLFLERKLKTNGRVNKRRTRIAEPEVAQLTLPEPEDSWPGIWYFRRLALRRLAPVCQITYDRVARVGLEPEGPFRLTLDRNVRGTVASKFELPPIEEGIPLLPGEAILELKFRETLPAPFKSLMQDLGLTPGPVSKYRLCVEACGLRPGVNGGSPLNPTPGESPPENVGLA